MNKRLLQFLGAENITQSQLADTLNVAKASVSNILAGRNRPGYDFIESLMLHYPDLNIEWLITGRGKMYKSPVLGDFPVQEDVPVAEKAAMSEIVTTDNDIKPIETQKKITGICIFFDDGTFQDIRV